MSLTALITGGTRGIGHGIAHCLAREGIDLALTGLRPQEQVAEAIDGLRALGRKVLYCRGDVSLAEDRARAIREIRDVFGQLNFLVNNAGVAPLVRADILEASEESFERLLRINLQGPYFLTQAVARWMIEQKRVDPAFPAAVVNISSVSATVASVNRGEYCISKAGLSMATQLWAVRLAEHGILVYEIRPGVTATDMTAKVKDKYDKMIADGLCLQPRWGTPNDIGRAVAMLLRGDLPYSTGQVITVDGGMTVQRL